MRFSEDLFKMADSDWPEGVIEYDASDTAAEPDPTDKVEAKRAKRRTRMIKEVTRQYQYRRAFSEVRLLEAMQYVPLEEGVTYNFITGGDVDSLSFLKVVLNGRTLDYVLCSTWCMAGEDILQLTEWYDQGRIRKLDMYVGEIFPNSYKVEWKMCRAFYKRHPEAGRIAVFRNHSKIFAGCNEAEGFYFGIQTSANINTTPGQSRGA